MKKLFLLVALVLPFLNFAESSLLSMRDPTHIEVNNRILANVNGKPISVYDVMKKMDMLFYKQYPHYASSVEARFQFYKISWKNTLQEVIDKELIMLDALEVGLPVSAGDVRQDMESVFGPNIHANLDKLGMTFLEAEAILKDEITIRRMLQARVGMKAARNVTPQLIKGAYDNFTKNNPIPPEFAYTVITIRDPNETAAKAAAKESLKLLRDEHLDLEKLESSITTLGPKGKITVSKEMRHTDKEISDSYKEVLETLEAGSYSEPSIQISKQDNSKVFRIFYLSEKKEAGQVPFKDLENRIKEELMNASYHKETDEYLQRMREHFHIDLKEIEHATPANFEPFALK